MTKAITYGPRRPLFLICLVAVFAHAGCNLYPYCLNCDEDIVDSGVDSGPDATADSGVDACVGMSAEECDGADNDCDGQVDEGTLPGEGEVCSANVGECMEGTTECQDGAMACAGGVLPMVEVCDNRDNDCDSQLDEGNPGGGTNCGTDVGECVSGINQCVAGSLSCVGSISGGAETCDGLDNDCDGMTDEDIAAGQSCGPAEGDTGACTLGTEMCVGGVTQCVGAVHPTTEQCDGNPDTIDHDCDGDPSNGFDLSADIRNCSACGNVCANNFTAPDPHAVALQCTLGVCEIAACATSYWDLDGSYQNGCEYGPCEFRGTQEACNQIDDDCDGVIDENLVAPDICSPLGACADPGILQPTCTAGGWVCDYAAGRPDVEVDMNGDIVPETLCDGVDNDCDAAIDEGDPLVNTACDDSGQGICRATGLYQCDVNPADPAVCVITTPGQTPATETCNNSDDDCDGTVDENPPGGDINQWVGIGAGLEIFAYEASRPDATPISAGSTNSAKPCSKTGVLPWTNITYPDAEAACAALGGGARLCTESEWQTACEGPLPATDPVVQDSSPDGLVVIEAENYAVNTAQGGHAWTLDTQTASYSGAGYMEATPDNGTNNNAGSAPTNSPRLDYNVNFVTTGTHYLWIRGYAPNGSANRVHAGIDLTIPTTADDIGNYPSDLWHWQGLDTGNNPVRIDVPSTGVHNVSVWMREDGFLFDKMIITTSAAYTPVGQGPALGCTWSYSAACDIYQPATCNGADVDHDPGTSGNQDSVSQSGEMTACYTDWGMAGHVHDLSGNIKEWTQARGPGINPLRGGSYTNAEGGMTCGFDFTAADDSFFFPNVGFRCCR